MSSLASTIETYGTDALRAFPAAVARVALGWKAEPNVRAAAGLFRQLVAFIGSVALGVMAGDVARLYQGTAGLAPLIVIAVAFNAQHICTRLIAASQSNLRLLEKQARDRIRKRFRDHDRK